MQFEQQLNARMLESCGRGFNGDIDHPKEHIQNFLNQIGSYPLKDECDIPDYFQFKDGRKEAARAITDFIKEFIHKKN